MVTIYDLSDFIHKSTMLLHHNLNAGTAEKNWTKSGVKSQSAMSDVKFERFRIL